MCKQQHNYSKARIIALLQDPIIVTDFFHFHGMTAHCKDCIINHRVVQKSGTPTFNFAITSVNILRF